MLASPPLAGRSRSPNAAALLKQLHDADLHGFRTRPVHAQQLPRPPPPPRRRSLYHIDTGARDEVAAVTVNHRGSLTPTHVQLAGGGGGRGGRGARRRRRRSSFSLGVPGGLPILDMLDIDEERAADSDGDHEDDGERRQESKKEEKKKSASKRATPPRTLSSESASFMRPTVTSEAREQKIAEEEAARRRRERAASPRAAGGGGGGGGGTPSTKWRNVKAKVNTHLRKGLLRRRKKNTRLLRPRSRRKSMQFVREASARFQAGVDFARAQSNSELFWVDLDDAWSDEDDEDWQDALSREAAASVGAPAAASAEMDLNEFALSDAALAALAEAQRAHDADFAPATASLRALLHGGGKARKKKALSRTILLQWLVWQAEFVAAHLK